MEIYRDDKKDKEHLMKIQVSDIDFYAKQLFELVTLYRKHIYVQSDKQEQALNELEYYARLLIQREYNSLISNAHELITTEDYDVPF